MPEEVKEKSPEELQLSNIKGSLGCAQFLLRLAIKEPVTLENNGMLNSSAEWLSGLSEQLTKEMHVVQGKINEAKKDVAEPEKA